MIVVLPILVLAYAVLFVLACAANTIPFVPSTTSSWRHLDSGLGQQRLVVSGTSQAGLEDWIIAEQKTARERLLANVSPGGENVRDAVPGSVIASPSREHPDYYYQWVRDAAITLSALVEMYAHDATTQNPLSSSISGILDAYATLQFKIQHTKTPSGDYQDLSGLGEPKFHADGSAFTGSWGRPQRDGPALRALTLMAYLRAHNATHPSLWASEEQRRHWYGLLYDSKLPTQSVIKADLEYVSHYWHESGFDLWEEVTGLHFFTAMVQLRALREGSDLATLFGDAGAAAWYAKQAERMTTDLMPLFWDSSKQHLVAALNSSRSGLDCAILLGSLHATPFIKNVTSTDDGKLPYPPHSDEVLLSLLEFVRDQRSRFPINSAGRAGRPFGYSFEATGLGRYPEDGYNGYETVPNGGNPWFLCTSSAAEILYRVSNHLTTSQRLHVTSLGLPFWRALLSNSKHDAVESVIPQLEPGIYESTEPAFQHAVAALRRVGDGFLAIVKEHAGDGGALSEQFDRETGFEKGARDLTWSYGALLQAVRAR